MAGTTVIIQSSYIPWKGYFDLVNRADNLVLFDDAQYTKNDWRNRNRIKTANGVNWLSIPVRVHGLSQTIAQTQVAEQKWRRKHWTAIEQSYSRAPHFARYAPPLRSLYLDDDESRLSAINRRFIELINGILGIRTKLYWSSEFQLARDRTQRLVDICDHLEANTYLTGPAAREYLDEDLFRRRRIAVEWMDYSGYPEYPQLYPPFEHHVSIVDLIFNTGPDAMRYLKSFGGMNDE